jgi:hypothetical protein
MHRDDAGRLNTQTLGRTPSIVEKEAPKARAGRSLLGLQEKTYEPTGCTCLSTGVDFAILGSS